MIPAKGPIRIGHIIDSSLSSPGFETIVKGLSIHKIWSKTVGLNISKRTRPLKLTGKTLYVTVATSTWMEELKYLKQDIIKKINTELKEEAVKDIIFRLGKIAEISTPMLCSEHSVLKHRSAPNPQSAACNSQYSHQLPQKDMENIYRLVNLIKNNELQGTILKAMVANKCQDIHTADEQAKLSTDNSKRPKPNN
ncbi:MAG: DUF721 domain-containing protein [Deltaproteobacteria bacterium]|nr:DUF721 domain-containing protein [Deltaproteobacteria bacterium]